MIGLAILIVVFYLAIISLMVVSMWLIYSKANKPGWAAIVPIYNIIIFLEIAGKPWWWIFLFCIPLVNIVFLIMAYNGLSKAFGKSSGFTVGLVFLGIVFFPILAFSSAEYNKIDQPEVAA